MSGRQSAAVASDIEGVSRDARKRRGRPALPPDQVRTARLQTRTYPDVAEKIARNGTEWLERIVRKAPDKPKDQR